MPATSSWCVARVAQSPHQGCLGPCNAQRMFPFVKTRARGWIAGWLTSFFVASWGAVLAQPKPYGPDDVQVVVTGSVIERVGRFTSTGSAHDFTFPSVYEGASSIAVDVVPVGGEGRSRAYADSGGASNYGSAGGGGVSSRTDVDVSFGSVGRVAVGAGGERVAGGCQASRQPWDVVDPDARQHRVRRGRRWSRRGRLGMYECCCPRPATEGCQRQRGELGERRTGWRGVAGRRLQSKASLRGWSGPCGAWYLERRRHRLVDPRWS